MKQMTLGKKRHINLRLKGVVGFAVKIHNKNSKLTVLKWTSCLLQTWRTVKLECMSPSSDQLTCFVIGHRLRITEVTHRMECVLGNSEYPLRAHMPPNGVTINRKLSQIFLHFHILKYLPFIAPQRKDICVTFVICTHQNLWHATIRSTWLLKVHLPSLP